MTRLHEEIETPLSLDVAFPFVADFANSSRWDPGVRSSEAVNPGPPAIGARYRLMVRMGGRFAPMEYRVSELEPMRRVVLTGSGSGVSAVDEIRFERAGTGSHIDYTADIRLGGLLRLVQPFLGGSFRKIAKDALAGMEKTLNEMSARETAAPQQPADPAAPGCSPGA